jgi:hypothetical protein
MPFEGYFHNFVRKRTGCSAIAKAIASSRSLTSASFRSVLFYDEIMKIALLRTYLNAGVMRKSCFVLYILMVASFKFCFGDDEVSLIYHEQSQLHKEALEEMTMLQESEGSVPLRCFFSYDAYGFLEQAIIDDGEGQHPDDLTGVRQREIICLQIGHQFPLVDKPLKIEKYVWDPHCSDANGILYDDLVFNYNEEGELVSICDCLGEIAHTVEPFSKGSYWADLFDLSVFCENMNFETDSPMLQPCNLDEVVSIAKVWEIMTKAFFSAFYYLERSAHQMKVKWNSELKLRQGFGWGIHLFIDGVSFRGNASHLLWAARNE